MTNVISHNIIENNIILNNTIGGETPSGDAGLISEATITVGSGTLLYDTFLGFSKDAAVTFGSISGTVKLANGMTVDTTHTTTGQSTLIADLFNSQSSSDILRLRLLVKGQGQLPATVNAANYFSKVVFNNTSTSTIVTLALSDFTASSVSSLNSGADSQITFDRSMNINWSNGNSVTMQLRSD
tara:strand:- start:363 stop:914 length:552 start_codon:yes stop_codon:yes gene_type:complete